MFLLMSRRPPGKTDGENKMECNTIHHSHFALTRTTKVQGRSNHVNKFVMIRAYPWQLLFYELSSLDTIARANDAQVQPRSMKKAQHFVPIAWHEKALHEDLDVEFSINAERRTEEADVL